MRKADMVLYNGKIHTVDPNIQFATAVAIQDGKFIAVGDDAAIYNNYYGEGTTGIDLKGKRTIPGLIDSHTHLIRGGLNYNLELRWDGVPSLADALRMLKDQVVITPSPQW